MIIDFHSHFLPQIDDGSKSVKMSCAMLSESARQGIDICIATPHFYGSRQILKDFLKARANAAEQLNQTIGSNNIQCPRFFLGAEVAYFTGISDAQNLDDLCIENTDLFMLEMPFAPWNPSIIKEVEKLGNRYHIILAHLERFFAFRENKEFIKEVLNLPVEVQVNAESLQRLSLRLKINKYFANRYVLGSDMHNMNLRPPNLMKGRDLLSEKVLYDVDHRGNNLLAELLEEIEN